MGFEEDITVYFWNWCIWTYAMANISLCWFTGGWGIFWDDDDGEWMNMCFNEVGGVNVKFPLLLQSSYAMTPPAPHKG